MIYNALQITGDLVSLKLGDIGKYTNPYIVVTGWKKFTQRAAKGGTFYRIDIGIFSDSADIKDGKKADILLEGILKIYDENAYITHETVEYRVYAITDHDSGSGIEPHYVIKIGEDQGSNINFFYPTATTTPDVRHMQEDVTDITTQTYSHQNFDKWLHERVKTTILNMPANSGLTIDLTEL